MRRKIIPIWLALLLPCICFSQAIQQIESPSEQQKEQILGQGSCKGKLTSLQWGDYLHATFKRPTGELCSFFVMTAGIDYFLALNKGIPMEVEYEVVHQYIPEAREKIKLERIVDVQAGNQRYSKWWKDIQAQMSLEEIERKFQPLLKEVTSESF